MKYVSIACPKYVEKSSRPLNGFQNIPTKSSKKVPLVMILHSLRTVWENWLVLRKVNINEVMKQRLSLKHVKADY